MNRNQFSNNVYHPDTTPNNEYNVNNPLRNLVIPKHTVRQISNAPANNLYNTLSHQVIASSNLLQMSFSDGDETYINLDEAIAEETNLVDDDKKQFVMADRIGQCLLQIDQVPDLEVFVIGQCRILSVFDHSSIFLLQNLGLIRCK